jgi:hypothetical protein
MRTNPIRDFASRFDVLLSFELRDRVISRDLARALEQRGLRPLALSIQSKNLKGLLVETPAIAVLVGSAGFRPWQTEEVRPFLHEIARKKFQLILVKLPGARQKEKLPWVLENLAWLDLRGGLTAKGIDSLAEEIREKQSNQWQSEKQAFSRLHDLPFESVDQLFLGRERELAQLEGKLTAHTQLLLHGPGGIGKTRLAVEFAWRLQYSAAFLVGANSAEELRSGIAALARRGDLDLREHDASAEDEVHAAVLAWLNKTPNWLLILDGADTESAASAVLELLSRLPGGHVLITSRLADWPGLRTLELGPLDSESAAAFLLARTAGTRQRESADEMSAQRLAELLGGLPLALEQAGADIAQRRISLSDYTQWWEQRLGTNSPEPIATGSPSDGIPAPADGPAPLEAAEILLLAFLLVAARRASPDLLLHLDAAVLREAAAGVLDEGDLAPSPDPLRAAAEVLARRLPAAKPDPLWRSWMLATQGKALQDLAAALAAPSAARLPA